MSTISKFKAFLRHRKDDDEHIIRPKPLSESTKKNDIKFDGLLRTFGEHHGVDPYSLTPEYGVRLINSLRRIGWSRSTIEKSFMTSFKRIYRKVNAQKNIDVELLRFMKCAIEGVVPSPREDKHPFILCDMFRLIRIMSREYAPDARMFSLITFAMFTGLRLDSVSKLTFADIENSIRSSEGEFISYTVSFRSQRVKGGLRGPPVSLKGRVDGIDWTDQLSVCNPIYWLNLYMLERFGIHIYDRLLPNMGGWKIWGWGKGAISSKFKRYISVVGYDPKLFSFHSLRKGMMSNRLLLTPSRDPGNVLDLVSMIGAWSLSSRARERYITSSLSRVYIANQFGESITSVELLTVNGFHRLSFPDEEAKWPMRTNTNKCSVIDRILNEDQYSPL
jgi:hypothetical protein